MKLVTIHPDGYASDKTRRFEVDITATEDDVRHYVRINYGPCATFDLRKIAEVKQATREEVQAMRGDWS